MEEILDNTKIARFPKTRYQGSKYKLLNAIKAVASEMDFDSVLDIFGGTGSVAYMFKQQGKTVVYNDFLKFNAYIAKALIQNKSVRLTNDDIDFVCTPRTNVKYPTLIQDNFQDIYYTDDENKWLDMAIKNIADLSNQTKKSMALFAIFQACIIKRPYNLFHRKNLYMRLSEVKRGFGNKASWDKSFDHYFKQFAEEANAAIFDNGKRNAVYNEDALKRALPGQLVYIDPPYLNSRGTGVDYYGFYHFLEGIVDYENWIERIDLKSKHKKLSGGHSLWNDKKTIHEAFDKLFELYQDRKLLISYRSDGIPTIEELVELLEKRFKKVKVIHLSTYKYVLSKNSASKEVLIVAE